MSNDTNTRSPMVVAGAQALCRHASAICGVDKDDNWKIYGDTFLDDADVVLKAAGADDLLDALKEAVALADHNKAEAERMGMVTVRPPAMQAMYAKCVAAIAKATGERA